jgi:hypothetical protein
VWAVGLVWVGGWAVEVWCGRLGWGGWGGGWVDGWVVQVCGVVHVGVVWVVWAAG